MSTPINEDSHVIQVIGKYLETGIPMNSQNYDVSSSELQRIRSTFRLYSAWRSNPFMDIRDFLMHVMHRSRQQIIGDLYCFNYIRSHAVLMLTKDDMRYIQQKAIIEAMQSARQNGESQQLLRAAKQLGELSRDLPDDSGPAVRQSLPEFYSTSIKSIAPDYQEVDSEQRRRLIAAYGGTPDANTTLVEKKTADMLGARDTETHKSE